MAVMDALDMSIETIYRWRIDYDYAESRLVCYACDATPIERIEAQAFAIAKKHGVHGSSYGGGAAFGAYMIYECDDKAQLEAAAKKLVRYIRRFKNIQVM
ncbi:hypothetical protein AB6809_29830 [Paraburkholderia sp. RCC_158]|uniref:hypothetical protein n=1 Tax=Paraburkholderia sp. RCC_158 TaxID=3239220 RepID=UPI003524E126